MRVTVNGLAIEIRPHPLTIVINSLNYSLSIGPYWGSDIGGFYPSSELTGEL